MLVNLTPHPITLIQKDLTIVEEISPEKVPLRIVGKKGHRTANFFPPIKEGVKYIVSCVVKVVYRYRDDFVVPHRIIRQDGLVVGCLKLR